MTDHPKLNACDPSQCIASRMLKCNRIITAIFRTHLLPYNITSSQIGILFLLNKAGEKSQQALADHLYLEKSTVSRNMQRLLQQGYIVRLGTKLIGITDKGNDFLETLIPAWDKAMAEARARLKGEGEEALTILLNQLTH